MTQNLIDLFSGKHVETTKAQNPDETNYTSILREVVRKDLLVTQVTVPVVDWVHDLMWKDWCL